MRMRVLFFYYDQMEVSLWVSPPLVARGRKDNRSESAFINLTFETITTIDKIHREIIK